MKRFLLVLALALSTFTALGQSVDKLYIDARGSFIQSLSNDMSINTMKAEYLNVHMWGTVAPNLSFRIRQRLNVGIDTDNPFRATDWMCLNWQVNDRLKLYTGKTGILIGGYEYDSAPIDIYFYSNFCNNLSQCFAFSIGGEYELLPGQKCALQIANSPLSKGFDDKYSYNLAWIGSFAPWWNTIWSFNLIDDNYGRKINYLSLGNHCVWGNLALDVDYINRASFQQKRYLASDWSAIAKVIWSVGEWNICGKIGYEMNDSSNFDRNGIAFDTVVSPGTEYIYGGVGLEFFPLGNELVRLHLASYTDSQNGVTSISLGLKWRFDII